LILRCSDSERVALGGEVFEAGRLVHEGELDGAVPSQGLHRCTGGYDSGFEYGADEQLFGGAAERLYPAILRVERKV